MFMRSSGALASASWSCSGFCPPPEGHSPVAGSAGLALQGVALHLVSFI